MDVKQSQGMVRQEKYVSSWGDILALEHGDACNFVGPCADSNTHYFYNIVGRDEFVFPGALFFNRTHNSGAIGYNLLEERCGELYTRLGAGILSGEFLSDQMADSSYWEKELDLGHWKIFREALERRLLSQGAVGKTPELSAMTGEWEVADDWLKRYELSARG